MKKEIIHKWYFKQSIEEVWEYLTKPELIEKWLMPNDFEPTVGHEFKFKTSPMPPMGLDGIFYCKVLEIVPFKKLVYSWKGGPGKEEITLDTMVEWKLESKDNGTVLHLLHNGFKEENHVISMAMFEGWNTNIEKIIALLN